MAPETHAHPWLPPQGSLVLAPMEGLADAALRALLCERGGLTYLVTEFVRISQDVPGVEALRRAVPELVRGGATVCGTPAHVQLLGSHPQRMAQAAARAVQLGAPAIDLNFGCPARTVNRNDGGASLLRAPDRLAAVVAAVRAAVPAAVPVSAKLRLGWQDVNEIYVTAEAAARAGADWLTLHARTRVQNYNPPVHWHVVGEVARRLALPVVANGDIFDVEALARCVEVTGCRRLMLGRGLVANPVLGRQARAFLRCGSVAAARAEHPDEQAWNDTVARYVQLCREAGLHPHGLLGRLKQWGLLVRRLGGPDWFAAIKRERELDGALAAMACHRAA